MSMSERQPPSTTQPQSQNETRSTMVIKFAPSFPISDFLGRADPRSSCSALLPPVNMMRPLVTSPHDVPSPHPLQLAPLLALTPPHRGATKAMSIAQLVANDEGPPRPELLPAAPQQSYRSPSESSSGSPAEYRTRSQPYDSSQLHRLDHPPAPFHPPVPGYQADGTQYPRPQDHPSHRAQYRPPVTNSSSNRTYYAPSTQSPRRSIAAKQLSNEAPRASAPLPFIFTLSIRQQPASARACGFGERDRRVIDPPPILELKITDRTTGAPAQDHNGLHAMHCTLLSPDNKENQTEVPPAHPDMASTRRLMGTLVASPYQAKDEHGVAGTFFVFPDLSCRSPGKYRLNFRLLRVDLLDMCAQQPAVALLSSDVFSVFTAKDFPGMRASSDLLKALRRQGLNVGVKKGSEARKGKGKAKKDESSDEEDSESDDFEGGRRGSDETAGTASTGGGGGVSPRTKTKKGAKRKRRAS